MFSKTYFVSGKANDRHQHYTTEISEKVKPPVEGVVSYRNIIRCTKPCLIIFIDKQWVIIIADSCFKSQEIDFENKVADPKYTNRLLGYVLKKAKKEFLVSDTIYGLIV